MLGPQVARCVLQIQIMPHALLQLTQTPLSFVACSHTCLLPLLATLQTPKGVIGRMIDGIRGKSSRIPESPVAMRDASDQHDQVPYMPPPYQQQPYQQPYQQQQYQRVTGPAPASGPMAQMPAAYTRRTDMDMPNTAAYIQPAPASNGYMASPTYRYPAQAPAPMAGGPMGGQGWTAEGY